MLFRSPLFGADIAKIWIDWALSFGFFTALGYVIEVLRAALIFIVERDRIKNVSWWKKTLICLLWPVFIVISVPIEFIALFSKNVVWKPIPHTDTTDFAALNEKPAEVVSATPQVVFEKDELQVGENSVEELPSNTQKAKS